MDLSRGCRAKVWRQTRNTPTRLGFAHEESQPHEPWCRCSKKIFYHPGVKFFYYYYCYYYYYYLFVFRFSFFSEVILCHFVLSCSAFIPPIRNYEHKHISR